MSSIVLTQDGELSDLGRSRRIANKHQTLALIARDGGCSFPGCDHPPEWCERHHVVPWIHDGGTDLKNLTLLCSAPTTIIISSTAAGRSGSAAMGCPSGFRRAFSIRSSNR